MSADNPQVQPAAAPVSNSESTDTVISALFADSQSAHAAVTELRQIGIPAWDISLIARNTAGDSTEASPSDAIPAPESQTADEPQHLFLDYEVPPDDPLAGSRQLGIKPDEYMLDPTDSTSLAPSPDEGIAAEQNDERLGNALMGAGAGGIAGMLVGIASLAIPGVGPILAAGPLAVALGGLIAGGAAGAVAGALATAGVPEEYAHVYAASIEQGQTLVSVHADELTRDAIERVFVANGGVEVH